MNVGDAQPIAKKREWNKIPFEKGSAEYVAEAARRHREKAREYARKKAATRPPPTENTISPGDPPPIPAKKVPVKWVVPDVYRSVLGDEIILPEQWTRWPLFHVRRQEDLSKTTMNQYRAYYHRLPRTDIFSVVKFIMEQSPATQNMYAKAGLSYVCDSLYNSIYVSRARNLSTDGDYKDRCLRMMVYSILNKLTKKESYERHVSQEASDQRIESTVPWAEWSQLGKNYIRAFMAKKGTITEKEKKDALIVYAYSQLPPVRLDWNDIKVMRIPAAKKFDAAVANHKTGNVLYLNAKRAVVCWSDFKNAANFKDLPVRYEIKPVSGFIRMMNKILPPGDSEPLKIANFSTYLSKLAEDITGKRFTNRLMRSSYIRWWHDNNDTKDLTSVKSMMRNIHQTNMEVHLGYIKHSTTDGDLTD